MAEDPQTKTLVAPTPDPAPDTFDEDEPASPFAIPNALLRNRGLIAAAVGIGVAAGLVVAVMQVPRFEAVARFVVSASTVRGADGAAEDLGPLQQRDPFDYYTTVLNSTEVLNGVLSTPRPSGGLIRAHLGLADGGADAGAARSRLLAADARLEATRRGAGLPVLMVRTTWADAAMAADLANAFLAELSKLDQRIKSTAADNRLRFVQGRTEETFAALTAAEDALRTFRETNRLVRGVEGVPVPPLLAIRNEQLVREVTLQTELYIALKKSADEARIAKLDDSSALVVIEPASPPTTRTGTARRTYLLAGALFGLLAGLVMTGVRELRRSVDFTTPEAQEFLDHLKTIRRQVTGWPGGLRGASVSKSPAERPIHKQDA